MWLHRFTNYLLRHFWQTLAFTFLITLVPTLLIKVAPSIGAAGILITSLLGTLGILIAALYTLSKNVVEGALLTVAATIPYLINLGGHEAGSIPLLIWVGVGVAVISNVLTWAFAFMIRRQKSFSVVLQIAALIGVLVISIIHLVYPDVVNWWGTELQASYLEAKKLAGTKSPISPNEMQVQLDAVNFTKTYATGFMVASVLFFGILQLIVARWWQALVYSHGTLKRELHHLRLSQLAAGLFIVNLILFYLGNKVALDIMPVLCLLFLAAGLSLVHYLFGLMQSPTRWFWLCMVYFMLIFAMPVSMVVVILLALADAWLDLRKRFRKI